jgi:hypothetical protein
MLAANPIRTVRTIALACIQTRRLFFSTFVSVFEPFVRHDDSVALSIDGSDPRMRRIRGEAEEKRPQRDRGVLHPARGVHVRQERNGKV